MYGMGVVRGEPFSQAAQSFMPELLYGTERSSEKDVGVHMLWIFLLLYFSPLSRKGNGIVILFFIYGLRHETGSNAAKIPGDYWSYTWSVSGIHRSIYSLAVPLYFHI